MARRDVIAEPGTCEGRGVHGCPRFTKAGRTTLTCSSELLIDWTDCHGAASFVAGRLWVTASTVRLALMAASKRGNRLAASSLVRSGSRVCSKAVAIPACASPLAVVQAARVVGTVIARDPVRADRETDRDLDRCVGPDLAVGFCAGVAAGGASITSNSFLSITSLVH